MGIFSEEEIRPIYRITNGHGDKIRQLREISSWCWPRTMLAEAQFSEFRALLLEVIPAGYQESNESLVSSKVKNTVQLLHGRPMCQQAYTFTTGDKAGRLSSMCLWRVCKCVFNCVCSCVQVVAMTRGQPWVSFFRSYAPCFVTLSLWLRPGAHSWM